MKNNGLVIHELQGSKKDFVAAWIHRLIQTVLGTVTAGAVIWFGKLILASVMYLMNTLPSMQTDINALKGDVKKLQETAVTKEGLSKELAEQLKKQKNRVVYP